MRRLIGRFHPSMLERWAPSRPRRVLLLVLGIIVLSLADLAVTIAYLRAQWMIEANPIAAYLIESTRSPWALAAFKVLTMGICVGLLLRVRKHLAGEVAAWCAIGILTVMSVMWRSYSKHFDSADDVVLAHCVIGGDQPIGLP